MDDSNWIILDVTLTTLIDHRGTTSCFLLLTMSIFLLLVSDHICILENGPSIKIRTKCQVASVSVTYFFLIGRHLYQSKKIAMKAMRFFSYFVIVIKKSALPGRCN